MTHTIIRIDTTAPPWTEGAPDDAVMLRCPHAEENPRTLAIIRTDVAYGSISVDREGALRLAGALQLFASTGRVFQPNNGLHGWNSGDRIGVALMDAGLEWRTLGPYFVAPRVGLSEARHFAEARRLGEDLLFELEAQKPRPVVIAQVVPWATRRPW